MEQFWIEAKPVEFEVQNKGIRSALVCCVLKSLCVFILCTPEDSIILAQRATLGWRFPALLFDPCSPLSPSPKPCLRPWLRLFRLWGIAGREPVSFHCALGCSLTPTCSTPPRPAPLSSSPATRLMRCCASLILLLSHTGFISLFLGQLLVCC